MAAQIGSSCVAHRSTSAVASTTAATVKAMTWTAVSNIKDVNSALEAGQADVTIRGSTFKTYIAGMLDATVEFEMVWDSSDADFTAIQTAFLAKTLVAMSFLDGAAATTGKQGFVANFAVTNFSRNEPLEEAVTVSVTLKPSTFAQWYTVPA